MRTLTASLLALALTAAACGSSGSAVIASTGGVEITEADVGALYESSTLPVDDDLRQTLFALIAREILLQDMRTDFGVELDTAQVDTLYDQAIGEIEAAQMTLADALGIPDAGTEMLRFNAQLGVLRDQVVAALVADPTAVAPLLEDPAAYTTVCASHVLVPTEEEALAVVARLEAGEELAAVAAEVSIDTSPGGDLGCTTPNRYVDEFAQATLEAPVGEVFGPVATQFGWHVLIVSDRIAPTEAELAADPEAFLSTDQLNSLWSGWFNEKLSVAEVTLDEKYGFWSPLGIIPPDRPDLVPQG